MSKEGRTPEHNADKILAPLSPHEIAAVLELETPTNAILEQLRPKIERGAYRLVISDDVLGRLPAHLISRALSIIYEAKGLAPLSMVGIGGQRHSTSYGPLTEDRQHPLVKYFRDAQVDLKLAPEDRALIVTEIIAFGDTVGTMLDALRSAHIKTDVATISVLSREVTAEGLTARWPQSKGVEVAIGMKAPPKLFSHRHLTDLDDSIGEIFAHRLDAHTEKAGSAGALIRALAEHVAKSFLAKG